MTRDQCIRYNIAKQEFKDQMDPTDLSRCFYVDCSCNVLGFLIIRSNGKMLAYNAKENQYSYSSEQQPDIAESMEDSQVMDFPPYEYQLTPDGNTVLTETHAFPDPYVATTYENLFMLHQSTGEREFGIVLTMINLLPTGLSKYQRFLLSHKISQLHHSPMNIFSLKEIEQSIIFLCLNGLTRLVDADETKNILLILPQDSFNHLISYTAENIIHSPVKTTTQGEILNLLQQTKINQTLSQLGENKGEEANQQSYI